MKAIETIPLERMRGSLARGFIMAQAIPNVSSSSEIDMTELIAFRNSVVNETAKKENVKITFTHLFLKASAQALRVHPILNSNLVADRIEIYDEINIGLVVVTRDDLNLAPVIHQVDKKPLAELARCANQLADKIRESKFSRDDFQGGTFSLSNIGMFGIEGIATPLIIPPQTAILLTGAPKEKPAVRNGGITIRSMMYVSLTFDHRVISGTTAGKFLQTFTDFIEHPEKLDLGI